MQSIHSARPENFILAALPRPFFQELEPFLERETTLHKRMVYEREKPIPSVYFPCNSVFSVLSFLESGEVVEVGTVGYEGLVGITVFLGTDIALESCVCQVEGDSWRMRAHDFKRFLGTDSPLQQIVQRYLLTYMSQISQSVACNRMHSVEERFSRWILMTHDRVRRDEFHLTQEFIADMLGVHRPSVSLVANAFQQAGFIRYSRGKITVLNRDGLEDTSCECYGIVRRHFEKFMGLPLS